MENTKKKSFRSIWAGRLLAFLLIFVTCFNMIVPAYAYTIVYIQCSIDLATWEIIAAPVRDSIGISSASNEIRRVEKDALETLKNNQTSSSGNISLISGLSDSVANRNKSIANGGNPIAGLIQNAGFLEEDNRVLSFPTKQTRRDSSTSTDYNNALNAVNEISFDLNQAFALYCEDAGTTKSADASAMLTAMVAFLNDISGSMSSDGTVTYKGYDFKWYTEKEPGGSEYINWFMLIYEAFNNYALDGDEAVTSDNVYSATPNQLTKALVGVFSSILDGLRGMLGLWSMDELLFNVGFRGKGYVGGIFPTSWEPYVWSLFTFMEIIAAMILLFGIINNVIKKAASTINTVQRLHFMSQLQDLFVCAIALALLPIVLRIVISLCSSFTQIIYEIVPDSATTGEKRTITESVARFGAGSGSLGGIIAQFLYFGIQISYNFIYAMRAFAVAILIIIAPVMIAMISVSNARKQATMQWMKELLAQICIQPIHSFCMAVILLLPTSSHGFDNILALYALLPFTSILKSFFFGSAGSWADQAAQKASKRMTGTMAAGAMGVAGAVAGGVALAVGGSQGGRSGGQSGGQSDGGSEGGGSEGSSDTSGAPDLNSAGTNRAQTDTDTGSSGGGGSNNGGSGSSADGGPTLSDKLNDRASQMKQDSYSAYDDYFDSGSIGDKARYGAASLGAAVLGGAAKVTAGAAKVASTPQAQAIARMAGAAGQKVGGFAMNTPPGKLLRRAGNAIANSNTANAIRQNDKDSASGRLDVSKADMAANLAKGVGQDIKNMAGATVDKGKTALKMGTGLALGAAGGVLGGMGGRQLVNLGSGMMASAAPNKPTNSSTDNTGSSNTSSNSSPASGGEQTPDIVPDLGRFAQNYEDVSTESYGDRHIGQYLPHRDSTEYQYNQDDLQDMGVSDLHYDRDSQATSIQYDMSKMTALDQLNAQQMMEMWNNGTDAERAYMQSSGIKEVTPVVRDNQVVGMQMSVDRKAYAQNYGVNINSTRNATRPMTITTEKGSTPQMIPNMSQHMEMSAQRNPNSAIATDVSPLRTSLTGRQPPEPSTPPAPTPSPAPVPPSAPTPQIPTPQTPPVQPMPAPAEPNPTAEQVPSASPTPVPDNPLSHQPSQLDNGEGIDPWELIDGPGDGPPPED